MEVPPKNNSNIYSRNSIKTILIISADFDLREALSDISKSPLNEGYYVMCADRLSDGVELIEETAFDLICIDYNTVGPNTYTLLEFTTKTLDMNSVTPKIVLTESFDHLTSNERNRMLNFASRVTCKKASYFNIPGLLRSHN